MSLFLEIGCVRRMERLFVRGILHHYRIRLHHRVTRFCSRRIINSSIEIGLRFSKYSVPSSLKGGLGPQNFYTTILATIDWRCRWSGWKHGHPKCPVNHGFLEPTSTCNTHIQYWVYAKRRSVLMSITGARILYSLQSTEYRYDVNRVAGSVVLP